MKRILDEFKSLLKSSCDYWNLLKLKGNFSKEEKNYIAKVKTDSNIHRMLLFIVLLFFVQIFNFILYGVINKDFPNASQYCYATLYLFIVSIVYFIILMHIFSIEKLRNSSKCNKLIYFSFWGFYSIWGLIFSIFDLIYRNSVSTFILLLTTTAVIPVFNSKEIFGFLTFDLLFCIISISIFGKDSFFIQYSILLIAIAFVCSQVMYYTYISSKISHKRMKHFAETDPLTGLLNRYGLNEWIKDNKQKCIEEKIKIAIGLLDIDYFKIYNDKYGHLNGDECLKSIAKFLTEYFSKDNNIICRFGGEEFVVILLGVSEDEAIQNFVKAKFLIQNKTEHINLSGDKITVSIGVAFDILLKDFNFNKILQRADDSLYKAKEMGRNLVVSDDGRKFA